MENIKPTYKNLAQRHLQERVFFIFTFFHSIFNKFGYKELLVRDRSNKTIKTGTPKIAVTAAPAKVIFNVVNPPDALTAINHTTNALK